MDGQRTQWQTGPGLIESVWRYRYWIVIAALLAGLAGYGLSNLQSEVYEAEARIVLGGGVFTEAGRLANPERRLLKETERITSQEVLAVASERLPQDLSVSDLRQSVSAWEDIELEAIWLTARTGDAELAADIANAVGEAYEEVVARDTREQAQVAITELGEAREEARARLAELQGELEVSPDDTTLQAEVEVATQQLMSISNRAQELAVDAALFGSGVELFEPAEVPEAPVQPRPLRTAAIAIVLAAMAAGAVGWWRAEYSQVAETAGDVARILEAPSLGEIPAFSPRSWAQDERPILDDLDPLTVEAFQFLVSSIHFALSDIEGHALAVTSVGAGEGKTVIAMNLAYAAVQDGSHVVVLDGDGRMRSLTKRLGLEGRPGLSDLMDGFTSAESCSHAIGRRTPEGRQPLLAIPAGTRPLAAGSYRRPEFRKALQEIKRQSELFLIDTPPLLAVSDGLQAAGQADGVLVVVRRGTPLSRLQQAKERLDLVGTPIIGFVLNRAKTRERARHYGQYLQDTAPERVW